MKKMKNMKTICLTLVALALVVTLNIGNALAYFTNYTADAGTKTIDLGFSEAEIEEKVTTTEDSAKKTVWITNTGDYDCYIRMKAYAGIDLEYDIDPSDADSTELNVVEGNWVRDDSWKEDLWDESWTDDDKFCYEFSAILAPGETTQPIEVSFDLPEGTNPDDFNVIIIEESTPVLYDSEGNPYADWDATMMDSEGNGGPTSEIK